MIKKQQQFILKGMNQDIAETKVQPELAHSIKNLRVITDEDSRMLSLVTEKGTLLKQFPNNFFVHSNSISEDIIPTYYGFGIDSTSEIVMENSYPNIANTMYLLYLRVKVYFKLDYSKDFKNVIIRGDYSENIRIKCKWTSAWDIYNVGSSFTKYPLVGYDPNTYTSYYNSGPINSLTLDNYLLTYILDSYNIENSIYSIQMYVPILIGTSYIPNEIFDGISYSDNEGRISAIINYVKGTNLVLNNVKLQKDIIENIKRTYPIFDPTVLYKPTVDSGYQTLTHILKLNHILNTTVIKKDLIIFGIITNKYVLSGGVEFNLSDKNTIVKVLNFNSITSSSNKNDFIKFLYTGNLNFNINNPIKTYVSYESENQQRVYWIDGINQPRVINITKFYEYSDNDLDNHFDFCTPIYCNETIDIIKKSTGGNFHSGVIQYFMTYIDQNGQESKAFYQSPLYYITDNDRGLSPEEMSTNCFEISIKNANFNNLLRDKLRIYSLQRTSLNSTPVAKLVYELKLTKETIDLAITDTGNIGSNVDPQILLMLGCDEFIPKTMSVKDSTLFFGNIKINDYGQITKINEILNTSTFFEKSVDVSDSNTHLKAIKKRNEGVEEVWRANTKEFQLNGTEVGSRNEVDFWNKNGSDNDIKGFMYQEEYMLGVQLLHKSGEWSEPIWVCDKIMTQSPVANPWHEVPYFYITYGNNNSYEINGINNLIDSGYIAIRPLVVYNDYSSARVLCCGVLNPVLKYNDLLLSSWFFRPVKFNSAEISPEFDDPSLTDDSFSYINALGNDDGSISIVTEIQPVAADSYLASTEVDSTKASDFKIMGTWRTFNSPEIEFEKINKINNNYDFYACADIPIHHLKYDIEMFTATSTETLKDGCGFNKKSGTINYMDDTAKSSMTFVGGKNVWIDKHNNTPINTQVFPWHNDVSYSGDLNINGHHKGSDLVYGAPEKKTITNWRISQHPVFKSAPINISINNISIVNEDSIFINGLNYSKNVDILVIGDNENNVGNVRIQYKSTPHAIIKFNYYSENGYTTNTDYAALTYGYLLNKNYDSNLNNHFKGRFNGKPTDTSMYENIWCIAGDSVKLVKLTSGQNITINWTKGDTYYQRYNCLKTYPFSHEAKNSVIDILSFMVQTRINIDGTYDKQKTDILHIEPENFNKLNDVYSQMDNFFTYHKLDPDRFQNTFPNLVTWSKQKVFGESIDSWTNIHLTNVLDLDGSLGEITALKLWNNKLIAFQQKGIALIKYNENAMIPQANGAPIVLMNSGIVSGKEYLTNQFGCQNEWSIVNAKSGLYFSDDYNHRLYVLSDGIKCISDELGFKSYLKNKNYSGVWIPNRNAGTTLHTYYDQQLGDIYFTDGSSCLTYNENLNLFTSFYDYTDVYVKVANPTGNPKTSRYYEYINDSYTLTNDTSVNSSKVYYSYSNKKLFDFVNIENKNYWILNDFTNSTPLFFEHRASDSLNIFGDNNYKDYAIELTANIDPHIDKIFDTVEIRGDSYNTSTNPDTLNSGYGSTPPFDRMRVTNEYQDTNPNNANNLTFSKDVPSNVKQKFRIWRAQIGRNQKQLSGESTRVTRDRIRNYWSRIKLTKNGVANLRAKIHDIVVDVYE